MWAPRGSTDAGERAPAIRVVASGAARRRSSRPRSIRCDDEYTHAAIEVAERAAGQQQRGVEQIARIHHPLQLADAGAKLAADALMAD